VSALAATSPPLPRQGADLDAVAQMRWRQLQQEAAAFIDRVAAADRVCRAVAARAISRVCDRPGFRVAPERERIMVLDRAFAKLPSFTRLRRQYKRTDSKLRLSEVRIAWRFGLLFN
jgi:hypothetical protein